jgi:hypothetical protein
MKRYAGLDVSLKETSICGRTNGYSCRTAKISAMAI